jgi:hypothetical protein
VKPEYRGSGVGKALFSALGKLAEEKDCGRIDWAVLKVGVHSRRKYGNR